MRPTKFRYSEPVSRPNSAMPSGHDPDLPLDLHHVRDQIEPKNLNSSGSGREQTGQHFDGGGFSRAVRSQEAEELAGSDFQVHIFDG